MTSSPEQPANLKSPKDPADNPDEMRQQGNRNVNRAHQGHDKDYRPSRAVTPMR